MKNRMLIILLVILSACATSKVVTQLSQTDVDRVAIKFPNYTLANLTKGKSLYEANCGLCHKLYSPSDFTEEKWNHEVPPMVKKVNKKGEVVSATDQELILKYVITMSTAVLK